MMKTISKTTSINGCREKLKQQDNMEQIDKKQQAAAQPKINMPRVGELMSAIRNRRTTADRFRFNMSEQDALDLLTAHYMFEVEARHNKAQLDENTIGNLRQMAHYITKPNPKFGVMMCGTCGNGKTTLMFALRSTIAFLKDRGHFDQYRNASSPYFDFELRIVDAREVIEIYKDRTRYADLRSERLLAIDDLGKEPAEVLDYGNVTNPLIDLLEYRYLYQKFTVITTNLDAKQIRVKYGTRIADRFNEMLDVIVFDDITYRR